MAHVHKVYRFENSIEHSFHFCGKYGRAKETRGKRQKRTPEQIKRQNRINRTNHIRRLIQANFYENDYWVTLMYPKGTRKGMEEVKADFAKFCRQMRKEYKLRGEPFKYIYRIEIGRLGGIHIHLIINRLWGTDILLAKSWPHGLNIKPMYERGAFRDLAAYITKELPEDCEQLSFIKENQKQLLSVNSSRNLIRPEPEVRRYTRRTVEKLVKDGPKPTEGFFIDKDSIETGVNPYTGYSYIRYIEQRIAPVQRLIKPPPDWRDTA